MSAEKISSRSLVLWALGAFLLLWLLVELRNVVALTLLSILFAYVLDPAVSLLEKARLSRKRRLSRKVAVFSIVLLSGALIGTLLLVAIPRLGEEIASFGSAFPAYAARARELAVRAAPRLLEQNLPPSVVESLEKEISGAMASMGSFVVRRLYTFLSTILQLVSLLIIPAMSIYLLVDGKNLKRGIVSRFPAEKSAELEGLLEQINGALSSYVRGQTVVCISMGVVCGSVFLILGLPYSLLLGVTAGLMEAVPVVGFLVTIFLVSLAGLSVSPMFGVAGAVLYAITNQVVGITLTPRVMGKHTKLHPFLVLLSIMSGIQLAGFVGALLALPVAASARVVLNYFVAGRGRGYDI